MMLIDVVSTCGFTGKSRDEKYMSLGFGAPGAEVSRLKVALQSEMPDRFEWMIVQYDRQLHPDAAFHFEVCFLRAQFSLVFCIKQICFNLFFHLSRVTFSAALVGCKWR